MEREGEGLRDRERQRRERANLPPSPSKATQRSGAPSRNNFSTKLTAYFRLGSRWPLQERKRERELQESSETDLENNLAKR